MKLKTGQRWLFGAFAWIAASLCVLQPAHAAFRPDPEVYLFRGFGSVFSKGLNEMASQLRSRGVTAKVVSYTLWESIAHKIIQDRERFGRAPVVLIGHSLGANTAIKIAEELEKRSIKVDCLIALAATEPEPLPLNVRKAVNYYFATKGWGERIFGRAGFRGLLLNKDFSKVPQVGHFNIDNQPGVQAEIVDTVVATIRSRAAENDLGNMSEVDRQQAILDLANSSGAQPATAAGELPASASGTEVPGAVRQRVSIPVPARPTAEAPGLQPAQ